MRVALHTWDGTSRPCRFSLCLQLGAVFADFDVDPDASVFARRVSFDGYGCCQLAPDAVARMSAGDSQQLLAMVEAHALDEPRAAAILRRYFRACRTVIWEDALFDHHLL